jgi:hypothetical protein
VARELFVKTRQVQVGFPGSALPFPLPGGVGAYGGNDAVLQRCAVVDLSVCIAGEDVLSVLTVGGEVLTLDMAVVQEREEKHAEEILGHSEEPDFGLFEQLSGGFSSSMIMGMDAISYPPILATASADKMVRLLIYG